jgi:Complex1_LYR-like
MRSLGDDYVKTGACAVMLWLSIASNSILEFRRHKDVINPAHIIGFLSQWKVYLDHIPVGPDAEQFRGKRLDPTVFEKVCTAQAVR